MRKQIIAVLLSLTMTVGSVGAIPVFAAETTAEEAVEMQEENASEQEDVTEATEDSDAETVDEEILEEPAQPEEEPVQENDIVEDADPITEKEEISDTVSTTETTEEAEEGVADSASEGDTATEIAEIEEPETIEEELVTAEQNEAAYAGDVVDSETCGENATWTLTGTDDNLTLTISGSGEMRNYGQSIVKSPWYSYRTKIKSVMVEDGITRIGGYAFDSIKKLEKVSLPDSCHCIGYEAFANCSSLTKITLPNNLETIELGVFESCNNLGSITIPNSVTSIEGNVFYNCRKLESVALSNRITEIAGSMFSGCWNLKNVNFPDGLTRIGYEAFYGCSRLNDVLLPEGLVYIEGQAFDSCENTITIPNSVAFVGDRAFAGCSVRFRGTKEQWNKVEGHDRTMYSSIVYNCFSVPASFKLSGTSFIYSGKAIEPTVTVSYENEVLKEGIDYKIKYVNNDRPGKATLNVIGIGKYSGTEPLRFDIQVGASKKVTCTNVASGIKVSWEKVEGATSYYVYRDNQRLFKTSALSVTDKDVKYKNGSKFVYKVVATAKGSGDSPKARTATMYRLMPVGITSLTNPSAGKMTVTYDYCYGGSGYVVRYGLKSDMSDAKVITVKGDLTTSRTFGGMQKGKTYYVQVRTYKIDNGVRYYSGYCTTKKITIKK